MRIPILYIYTLLLAAVALVAPSCHNHNEIDGGGNNPMEIKLWADVGHSTNASLSSHSTRGNANSTSGIITAATDSILTIGMARIDEVYSPYYPAFKSCGEPIIAELGLPNASNSYIRQIDFVSRAQFFYNATDMVKYTAWQPWKPNEEGYEYSSTDDGTTVKIPITGDSDILYGNVTTGSQADGFELMSFEHALCMYRIYIYSMQEEGSDTSMWGVLEDMEIENLPTSCKMTLPTDSSGAFALEYEGTHTLNLSSEDNNIYFSPGGKIPAGLANRRMVSKCVVAPPSDGVLNIRLKTTSSANYHRVSVASNFKAGHAYDIVLRFSNHGLINGEASVSDWRVHDENIDQDVEVDMFYNLSNYETANSYIINSANYGYCFNGTIKGNGDSSLVGNVGTTINPGYIDILWDDTPNITINGQQQKALTLDVNKLSEGRVLFHVQGNPENDDDKSLLTEGNVVIAAYDQQGGNILWTWHIWLTDRVKAQGYPNGYIVQDRNLGAVSSVNDNNNGMDGLYFQWGRPTPFHKVASGIYGNVSKVPSNAAQVTTVDEAIANPTTLYGSGDNARHDWLATQNNALWGYQNDYTDLEKTIYDPCPPGYMVADLRVWQNIAANQVNGGWHTGTGVNLSVAGNNVWYPFQGHINADGTEYNTRDFSRLWSSAIDLDVTNTPPYELRYTASGNSSATTAESYRNRALPVRCVSKHSTTIITNLSASQTANCYMVHRAGYYKFKATVRGNGVNTLVPVGGSTSWDISDGLGVTIKPAKVDFLWWQGDFETVKSTTQREDKSDLDLIPMKIMNNGEIDEDGYILFYVSEFRKGNVGLVAYDVDGEILWNWHIWFTDKPVDKLTGDYTLMDRFLGATTAPTFANKKVSFSNDKQRLATYGFYYQWGKKDPFFGPPAHNSGDETVSNNRPKTSRYWVKAYNGDWSSRTDFDTETQKRIAEVVKNPMKFYKGTETKNDNSSWVDPVWVDGKVNGALWGYASLTYEEGQGYSKTYNDPCPPGYMAMFNQAWTYRTDKGYTLKSEGGFNYSDGEQNYDNSKMGIVLCKSGFEEAWYPFVGYRNGLTGGYTDVSETGHAVTGLPYKQWNIRSFYYTTSKSEQINKNYGAAIAMPMRCQKQ